MLLTISLHSPSATLLHSPLPRLNPTHHLTAWSLSSSMQLKKIPTLTVLLEIYDWVPTSRESTDPTTLSTPLPEPVHSPLYLLSSLILPTPPFFPLSQLMMLHFSCRKAKQPEKLSTTSPKTLLANLYVSSFVLLNELSQKLPPH